MNRWATFGSIMCFLMAVLPAELLAQFNGYDAYAPAAYPRVRRANREQAVAAVGPIARGLVETYGEEAVAAIFACSKPVAVKLAEFYASGEMEKLSRPRGLLYAIAQPGHGDDVALFAIDHARELGDLEKFDAYMINPLDYALGLKNLEVSAAELRSRRSNQATIMPRALSADEKLAVVGVGCLIILAGLILWQRRQSAIY
jgi:hypothetical protein